MRHSHLSWSTLECILESSKLRYIASFACSKMSSGSILLSRGCLSSHHRSSVVSSVFFLVFTANGCWSAWLGQCPFRSINVPTHVRWSFRNISARSNWVWRCSLINETWVWSSLSSETKRELGFFLYFWFIIWEILRTWSSLNSS